MFQYFTADSKYWFIAKLKDIVLMLQKVERISQKYQKLTTKLISIVLIAQNGMEITI